MPAIAHPRRPSLSIGAAIAFSLFALVVVSLPARPIDVSAREDPVSLPATIGARIGTPGPLSARESLYFERFGGSAARARYADVELLVVRTSAPLRHLHAPTECLTGAGYDVRYLGAHADPVPQAIYHAVDSSGTSWSVATSFVSDSGEVVTSVGEAVWSWIRRGGGRWTMVQRIAPAGTPDRTLRATDAAIARALDLPTRGVLARAAFRTRIENNPGGAS